ncbi:MAG: hypothetical protein IKM09_05015 [Clostridia bacterium]|nr:hypothetical protein [Clostridia bacterium]
MSELKNKVRTIAESKTAQKPRVAARRVQKHSITENKLEVLITVVNRSKTEYFTDLIQSFDVNMQIALLAEGTADAKMLNYLGLAGSEKSVIISVIRSDRAADALAKIDKTFKTVKNASGIAFTVSMTSIIGVSVFGFLSNNRMTVKEEN